MAGGPTRPALSVVVVAFDMARELPRTLRTLSPGYQRGVEPGDYEVVVVDNGSPTPVDPAVLDPLHTTGVRARCERLDPAPPSPARAANLGVERASGDLVGLLIDGARMASPGLLQQAELAARLHHRPVIATLAWHLGAGSHMEAGATGYDQAAEDHLLAEAGWEDDGYRLFGVSTLAASSQRGWFGPLGESNALFMPRTLWRELGGVDERFVVPGGGRANHDLFRRACLLPDSQLVLLLGEGTFHQIHGGASTSRRVPREPMEAEYERLRGEPFQPPDVPVLYVGTVPPATLPHLAHSVGWASGRHAEGD
jgi:hypothetical protein